MQETKNTGYKNGKKISSEIDSIDKNSHNLNNDRDF